MSDTITETIPTEASPRRLVRTRDERWLAGVSAGLGRYIHYVPYPVTTGFTAGIAVVIATLSLNDFLGLELGQLPNEFVGKLGKNELRHGILLRRGKLLQLCDSCIKKLGHT